MRRAALPTLLCGITATFGLAAPAAADDIGTFPGGNSSHVARDSATRAIFPLDLPGSTDVRRLGVRTIAVRQNDIPATDLFEAVTVKLRKRLPAIVVVLDDPKAEAGQYDVTAQLLYRKKRQLVTFTLLRDSAEVKAPASVVLTHTQGWDFSFWWSEEPEKAQPVRLRIGPHDEVSATDLRVAETDTTIGSVCDTLSAAGEGVVALTLEPNGVALGESKHVCEITSPKLAQPLEVAVSVTSHRSVGWIALLVVLGVAAGYGVRHYVTPRLALLRAQLALARMHARITQALHDAKGAEPPTSGLQGALAITNAVPEGASVEMYQKATDDAWAAYLAALKSVGGSLGVQSRPRARTQAQMTVAALQTRSALLEGIRAVLLITVLVLTAYGLFADSWAGTWQQMVTVVSWAFALDVTASAVQQELSKVTPQPA